MGLEDVTHTQCTALRPRGAGQGEPWRADPGLCVAARRALAVNPSRPQAEVSVSSTSRAAPAWDGDHSVIFFSLQKMSLECLLV